MLKMEFLPHLEQVIKKSLREVLAEQVRASKSKRSEYLPLTEVAEKLGVTVGTVRRYIRQGKLQSFRTSRKNILVHQQDLDAFVNRNRRRL